MAWQAFIGELLEPEQLKRGIALNSTQFNLSRVIGPAIGGVSIGLFGIAGSYYLNALTYIAIIVPLLFLRTAQKQRKSERQSILCGMHEGLSYVYHTSSLQKALLLQFVIAFLVFPYMTLLPIFARDTFHIGPMGLGAFNAAAGIGALTGALLLLLLSQRLERRLRLLVSLSLVAGMACIAFALFNNMKASLFLLIVLGACTVASLTVTNTIIQSMTPAHLRARVLSIWILTTLGFAPFGNLIAGWVAQAIGAPLTTESNTKRK